MRAAVYERTEFRCSAGIAHCKTLAKLCCGLNKPNKQEIVVIQNWWCFEELVSMIPLNKFDLGPLANS